MHLGLEPGAQLHQLGPVAHQLAQLTQRRRSDPRLRQAPQAQHVGQVGGVDDVVLDPPLTPVQRVRVGQVHRRTQLLQHVHRPVPPVRRLQHDLRTVSGRGHRLGQRCGAVVDPHHRQPLATRAHPNDNPAATVEINPDVLSSHRGLLLFERLLWKTRVST